MKQCRKCKKQYKDMYSFCPKCGTPFDKKTKRPEIPVASQNEQEIKDVINLLLYIIGIGLIVYFLLNITKRPIICIIGLLFSISIFPIIYQIIYMKNNIISQKNIIIARIIIPIVLLTLLLIGILIDKNHGNNSNDDAKKTSYKVEKNDNIKKEQEEKKDEIKEKDNNESKKENQKTEEKKEEPKKEEKKKTIYKLNYNEQGQFGKKQDYEGVKEYFYYIPTGSYYVTRISGEEPHCYLWIYYKKSYQDTYGTVYNSKESFDFSFNGQIKSVTITNDVMVYNSNKCSYEFEKK